MIDRGFIAADGVAALRARSIVGLLPRMAELLCERNRSWVCCRGWPRFGYTILDDWMWIRGFHSKIRGSEVCMHDPRIIEQSLDPRFAQQNPWMVRIHTLHLTYIHVT